MCSKSYTRLWFVKKGTLQMELMAMALACDLSTIHTEYMAQVKLKTIQIVINAQYQNVLIQIIPKISKTKFLQYSPIND